MNHPLATFMKQFFSHYLPVQKGFSVNTIKAYRDTVRLLLCYAADTLGKPADVLDVEDIAETTVLGFLDHLEQERGCSPRTRNQRLAALHSVFAFIGRKEPALLAECRRVREIPQKRTEHKQIGYLEDPEMQAILDAVEREAVMGVRDSALLLLLYNTGARVNEVVMLTLDDLHFDGPPFVRLTGKGNKERMCPLWPETVKCLQDHIDERTPRDPNVRSLFLNATGAPISRFGIGHILAKHVEAAKKECASLRSKNVTPHTIRHTTAMHLLRAGNDVHMVSYWLGHADLNTTHVYVEIDMEMKRKMIEKIDAPKGRRRPAWKKPGVLQWLKDLTNEAGLCGVKQRRTA